MQIPFRLTYLYFRTRSIFYGHTCSHCQICVLKANTRISGINGTLKFLSHFKSLIYSFRSLTKFIKRSKYWQPMANPKASSWHIYVAQLDNGISYLIARTIYLASTLICKLLIHIFAFLDQTFNVGLPQQVLMYGEHIFFKKKNTI